MKYNDYEVAANHTVNAQLANTIKKIERATSEFQKGLFSLTDVKRRKQLFNSMQSHYQSINGTTKMVMILCGICLPLFVALLDSVTLGTVAGVICMALAASGIVKVIFTVLIVAVFLAIEVVIAALIAKGEDNSDSETTTKGRKIGLKLCAVIMCFMPACLYYAAKMSLLAQLPQSNIGYIAAQKTFTYLICGTSVFFHVLAIFLFKYTAQAWQYFILYSLPKAKLEKEEHEIVTNTERLQNELVSDHYPLHDQQINSIKTIQRLSPEVTQAPITMSPKALALRQSLTGGGGIANNFEVPSQVFNVSSNELVLLNKK